MRETLEEDVTRDEADHVRMHLDSPHEAVLPCRSHDRDDHALDEGKAGRRDAGLTHRDERVAVLTAADQVELPRRDARLVDDSRPPEPANLDASADHEVDCRPGIRRAELHATRAEHENDVDVLVMLHVVQRAVLVRLALHEVAKWPIRGKLRRIVVPLAADGRNVLIAEYRDGRQVGMRTLDQDVLHVDVSLVC